jgi:hypothetical protein
MSKVLDYGSGYIDEFFAFYPLFVLTSPPLEITNLSAFFSFQPWGSINPSSVHYHGALETPILDAVIHPDLGSYLYLEEAERVGDPAQLWRLDPVTGESTLVDLRLAAPSRIVIGRHRDVYVVDGESLACVNIDLPEPEEVARRPLPFPVDAVVYDDVADRVVVVAAADRQVLRYTRQLDGEPIVQALPADVPLAGHVAAAWDPSDEALWLISDASDALYHLRVDPFSGRLISEEVSDGQLMEPRDIDVGDSGRVFVSSQGRIMEFEPVGDGRGWALVADPVFPDVEAGDLLMIARSRTNFDPRVHTLPAWYHVLPEQFGEGEIDCAADVDGSGVVDFADILVILSSWGPCPPDEFCAEDLDYGGSVDFADILVILSSWGPCP